jgi:hypothetical protein
MPDDHSTTKSAAAALDGLGFDQAFLQFVVGDLAQRGPGLKISYAKWPIKVTSNHLISQLSRPASQRTSWKLGESRPPPPPPLELPAALRQDAEAIGNRWARLIAWLEFGELVAVDMDGKAVPQSVWRRPDAVIDVGTGDFYVNDGKELLGRGLTLRITQPATVANSVKKGAPTEESDSGLRRTISFARKVRGPKSKVGRRVRDEMRRDLDLRDDGLTVEALGDMPEKELAARYKASRDTCRKAREAILSEFLRNK